MKAHIDKPLASIIAVLVVGGAGVFISAAFGLLARGASHISSVVFNHLVLGVSLGLAALAATTFIEYRRWRVWAPYLYGCALLLTALVFVPHVGFMHGGGRRWIEILGFTFQPSEALKIATILMVASYFSTLRGESGSWRGLAAFAAILAPPTLLLVIQPDIGTLGVICIAALAVYVAAGARLRDIAIIGAIGVIMLGGLAYLRPYMLDRVTTFINPAENPLAEGYQIKQSLIAIGSGGVFGRGFGQSVQKFTYLPEPMGDSIFAVAAEEIGFIGGSAIIGVFLLLALRGFAVAARAPDYFGALAAVGISTYFVSEAFINIGSMLGLAPLTGIPLTFISQGGSAMLVSLGSAGILLGISRYRPKK
ncbi:MAG: rod shape-determining protein RodA/cell division protein FtsW [Parcubacteria group bacterium Gr01-1014_8]|nr:MAG: rod shape-determining protein RodA/cell division protein FtsW [Parcubacteria group bacterium Gr01-1014_8]